ncbi:MULTISPECIES: Mu transposase C-terminal domain-containing protein [unclassified Vibrio]|uniref:Mu transposase C-terminal domain-containing protein n=1 Tax=unclassified Vibrio TaxID=2614977 RepID=UPI0012A9F432|nr:MULTISPECIES: Mu transposase C-terminal domain-containing protein [unclassified Vibrio]QFT34859.1 Transposon Tn7 transposition protein TnsB [Vibrio sp. THAF64]QGM32757.1 Transposon Tn7 transposition protein TnsB [Vibrio sp. THAF191d]QGN68260.1 Transposon Tn7 transposition protein TnsB [Vibrio sp. THAF191c]
MTSYKFVPGLKVYKVDDATPYEVVAPINMRSCVVRNLKTDVLETAFISDFTPEERTSNQHDDLSLHSDEQWLEAKSRYEIIAPILEKSSYGSPVTDLVKKAAKQHSIGSASIWRWIRTWHDNPKLSSLISKKTGIAKGTEKLSEQVNLIINDVIQNEYLTSQKKSIASVCREIDKRCKRLGIKPPHPNTIRLRIRKLPAFRVIKSREGRSKAEAKFSPSVHSFPDAHCPLSVYQIDHTPADVIIVDEISRQPLGRPWITLAIDVHTRMVAGLYLTLEKPSAISVGMCLAHAFLSKDKWLAERGIDGEWPIWGLPQTIHADNAKEFRGGMLKRACEQYSMDLTWRPVARPQFGAHVERLLGTLNQEIKQLPGTTFSSIEEKGDYSSTKKAALTLQEFETWLVTFIINVYHKKYHSTLMMSPLAKLEEGVFGNAKIPGIGLPRAVSDESKLLIDFMPLYSRTVQRYGIKVDDINYFSHSIVPWINETDPDNPKVKRKFIVRRDPRDISQIYFFDPIESNYISVPYQNISHPKLTLSELKSIKKKLKESGKRNIDEDSIFDAYDQMNSIVEQATKETKSKQRAAARKRYAKKAALETKSIIDLTPQNSTEEPSDIFDDQVAPFTEIKFQNR